MSKEYKGSGGAKPAKIVADNLFSRDVAEMTLAYGEGPIKGLYQDTLKSVKVGGTDLQDEDGKFNFEDFVISIHQGYANDTPLVYALGGESSTVNAPGSYQRILPGESKTLVIPANSIEGLSSVDIRLAIEKLYSVAGKDNAIGSGSMLLQISWSALGSGVVNYINDHRIAKVIAHGLPPDWEPNNPSFQTRLGQLKAREDAFGDLQNMASRTNAEILTLYQIIGKTETGYIHEISFPVTAGVDIEVKIKVVFEERILYEIFNFRSTNDIGQYKSPYNYKFEFDRNYKPVGVISWQNASLSGANNILRPNLFCAQITVEMTDRFTSLPDIGLDVNGLMIDVPSNYNAETRVYSGFWNGLSFKKSWSDNPVWVLRYLIMSQKHGIAKTRPAVLVNEAQFYAAAQYCDTLVFDQTGDIERKQPRFTFNDVVSEVRDAEEFLAYVAGTFNATVFQEAGIYQLLMDIDKEPLMFFAEESVSVEGFNYSFSDLSTRYNDMTVIFSNKDNNFEEDRRRIYNQNSIDKYGAIINEFQAVGCTSLYEALRKAFFRMITNQNEVMSLSFSTPRPPMYLRPYDTFKVCDPQMLWGNSGRLIGAETGVLHLRDPLEIPTGNYTATLQGVPQFQVHYSQSQPYQLTYTDNLMAYAPLIGAETLFMLESGVIGYARVFRVVSIANTEDSFDLFTIEASLVDRNKYVMSDNCLMTAGGEGITVNTVATQKTEDPNRVPSRPILNVISGPFVYSGLGQSVVKIRIFENERSLVKSHKLLWAIEDDFNVLATGEMETSSYYFEIPITGVEVKVRWEVTAISKRGKESYPTKGVYKHKNPANFELPAPTTLKAVYTAQTENLLITWDDPEIPLILGYDLVITNPAGDELLNTRLGKVFRFETLFDHPLAVYTVHLTAYPEDMIQSREFASTSFNVNQKLVHAPTAGNVFLDITASPYEIAAYWLPVVDEYFQSYVVKYTVSDDPEVYEFDSADNTLSLGLERAAEYVVEVRSRSIHGLISNEVLHMVLNTIQGRPPTNLHAMYTAGQTTVNVNWTSPSPLFSYVIELVLPTPMYIDTGDNHATFNLANPLPIGTYTVNAYAQRNGLISVDFTSTTFTVVEVLYEAPAHGSLDLTPHFVFQLGGLPNQLNIFWDLVFGATDYKVEITSSTGVQVYIVSDLTLSIPYSPKVETLQVKIWSRNNLQRLSISSLALELEVPMYFAPTNLLANYDSVNHLLHVSFDAIQGQGVVCYEVSIETYSLGRINTRVYVEPVNTRVTEVFNIYLPPDRSPNQLVDSIVKVKALGETHSGFESEAPLVVYPDLLPCAAYEVFDGSVRAYDYGKAVRVLSVVTQYGSQDIVIANISYNYEVWDGSAWKPAQPFYSLNQYTSDTRQICFTLDKQLNVFKVRQIINGVPVLLVDKTFPPVPSIGVRAFLKSVVVLTPRMAYNSQGFITDGGSDVFVNPDAYRSLRPVTSLNPQNFNVLLIRVNLDNYSQVLPNGTRLFLQSRDDDFDVYHFDAVLHFGVYHYGLLSRGIVASSTDDYNSVKTNNPPEPWFDYYYGTYY